MLPDVSIQRRSRDSLWLVLAEFAVVAALFVADIYHHILLSKTPYLFLLGWASLRLRGMRWKDVGFARPRSWSKAFLAGIAFGVGMELFELFVSQPLLARWLGKMPDLSDFADMVGNLKVFLIYIVLVWVLGALGEEIVYRGYLMRAIWCGIFMGHLNGALRGGIVYITQFQSQLDSRNHLHVRPSSRYLA
jgi:membrane protease YdiL (CAAX protease family)